MYHSGSPRVFSPEAVDWWSAEIGLNNSYRVVNNQDVIPSLPPVVIPGRGNFGCARHCRIRIAFTGPHFRLDLKTPYRVTDHLCMCRLSMVAIPSWADSLYQVFSQKIARSAS